MGGGGEKKKEINIIDGGRYNVARDDTMRRNMMSRDVTSVRFSMVVGRGIHRLNWFWRL